MASSSSPLLERVSIASSIDIVEKDGCNKLRKCSLICQPITLLIVLALCVIALVYPFWTGSGTDTLSATSSHPFITKHEANYAIEPAVAINKEESDASETKTLYTDAALSDQVSSLPGIESDSISFNHFSGYVEANDGKELHYWFFEAQENADKAPLFFWTNGGPGCSGLCGLLTEHGPFWSIKDGDLFINEFSWNKEVNIVYFEQPYGVGFSTVAKGKKSVSGDAEAVSDFDAAIRSFITKFPSFKERVVYLSSESFGGHYMPLTALEIMKNNEAGSKPHINLGGFMVGNPYTNGYENTIGAVEAFYGHGLMRNDIYETWKEYCFADEVAMDNTNCKYLYAIAYYEADNIDHYALDFDYCVDDISWDKHKKHLLFHSKLISRTIDRLLTKFQSDAEWDDYTEKTIRPMFDKTNRKKKRKGKLRLLSRKDVMKLKARIEGEFSEKELEELERRRLNIEWQNEDTPYYPCAADLMTTYLNEEIVQDALNVKKTDWTMCNNHVFRNWPEDDWDNKMQPYYAQLAAKYPKLKILVFSGDDDSVCGLHGTQFWLDNMDQYGWSVDSDNEWEPWEYDNQLAGYSTTYLTSNGNVALYFHTVRTAGHMVPQCQPSRALGLLRKFLTEME